MSLPCERHFGQYSRKDRCHICRAGAYCVTNLRLKDPREICALGCILEERAIRAALQSRRRHAGLPPQAAADCANAGDVASEIAANRRFHFVTLEGPSRSHTFRLNRMLWDSVRRAGRCAATCRRSGWP